MQSSVNPFTPVFGKNPSYFAGREDVISDISQAFELDTADPNLSSIFVGARGTGKTALLSRLAEEAEGKGWIAVSVTSVPGMLEDIVQRISERGNHLLETGSSRKVSAIEIAPLGSISWDSESDASPNWRSQMNGIFDQLAETDTGVLITVDEVDPSLDEMTQLATIYQHFIRENRKVSLLMAGLPHNISTLLSGRSTSFLRRAFRHDLGSIPASDIEQAFRLVLEQNGKSIGDEALSAAVEAIGGFPFMFQLVGYRTWNAARENDVISQEDVVTGVRLAQDDLRRQIYDATYNELSEGDIDFLEAMLVDEKASDAARIAERLGKSRSHVSIYKKRLLEAGVIEEGLRGRLQFALPGFREYLESVE